MAITDKTCLIMDEVDGMSAGDRGGVGALNALIKKTRVDIIPFLLKFFSNTQETDPNNLHSKRPQRTKA